jgi:negative regulator of sigma E activity
MSEELLSAMMDGECKPAELQQLLAELEQSPALRARWSRMCLARDALAGVSVRKVAPDFSGNVMAAIALERAAEPVSNVVPLRRHVAGRKPSYARRHWQPLTGLAAAASIAIAVVVGGRSLLLQPTDGAAPVASGAANATQLALRDARVGGLQPVSTQVAESAAGGEPTETRWAQLDADSARQLNDYLMEHSNSRAEGGMGGSLSYARLAVRTADYRPAAEQR